MATAFGRRDTDQVSTAFHLHVDSGRIGETFKSSCSKSSQVYRRCKPRVTRYSPQHKRDLRKAMPQCTRSLAPEKLTLPRAAVLYLCRFLEICISFSLPIFFKFFHYDDNNPLCDCSYTIVRYVKGEPKESQRNTFRNRSKQKPHFSFQSFKDAL